MRSVLAATVALASANVFAADVQTLDVQQTEQSYRVHARITLAAPRADVYRAATAFERLPDYAAMIESTERIGDSRLSSQMHLCVVWYCKTVRQVMDYREHPPDRLDMTVVPGAGDLKAGRAHWLFHAAEPNRTTLIFNARLVPDFWVPPLIGPWAIKKALREQIRDTAQAIETFARQSDKSPPE